MPAETSMMAKRDLHPRRYWQGLIFACVLHVGAGCASAPAPVVPPPPPTSATVGATTIVAVAPVATPSSHGTLGQFLGVPKIASGVGGLLHRIGSRLLNGLDLTGRFPNLQPKPPVLALSDPANLQETAPPAVQAAAEIKAEEDAAPQKIMAIRYLATLGCGGCYEKVEDALLEALSDCTEEVRYEAVKALQCRPQTGCRFCHQASCCSEKVRKRLLELTTCEKEPSERIRRNARITLACCGTVPLEADDIPREGPPPTPTPVLPPVVGSASRLFDGIQLVSFETLAGPVLADDPVLAEVNGSAIYRSQVLPLVDERLKTLSHTLSEEQRAAERERLMSVEVQRVIDWKLMEQFAKQDVYPSSTSFAAPFSPPEIQLWFERRLNLDPTITPQQVLAHYEVYRERYRVPVRVRWECSRVWIERCANPEQARTTAAYLRNRAVGGQMLKPASFTRDQVTAETYDWMELEQVEPALVRETLRTLQNAQVSPILEQGNQLLLLRMLERTQDEFIPPSVVADRIRDEIMSERRVAAETKFLAHLRANSRIATVFDQHGHVDRSAGTLEPGAAPPITASQVNQAVGFVP